MNRGSKRLAESFAGCASGFNEAPIHESGKFDVRLVHVSDDPPGFNEAPIHESGKSG